MRTPLVLLCIAFMAFAPLIGAGAGDLSAILVPLWLGGPDGRVVLIGREPLPAAEQLLPLFCVRASRAPPQAFAAA
jgi:hypothetical protein